MMILQNLLLFIQLILLYHGRAEIIDDRTCPPEMLYPNVIYPHEKVCNLHEPGEVCHSCCGYNEICCDDGSCIDTDRFCRYPSTCCSQKYCGSRCCNATRGDVACGPICAINGYKCCDATTGQLCPGADICCGDHCCPPSHFCCNGKCCEHGETCCDTVCCPKGHQCCENDYCCPGNSECDAKTGFWGKYLEDRNGKNRGSASQKENPIRSSANLLKIHPSEKLLSKPKEAVPVENISFHRTPSVTNNSSRPSDYFIKTIQKSTKSHDCCPDHLVCGEHLCCNEGDFCVGTHDGCCDHAWCGEICCHKGFECNYMGGCCGVGMQLCPGGGRSNCYDRSYECCPDGRACPRGYQCMPGNPDWCCPHGYNHFASFQHRCYIIHCEECGREECCTSPYHCDSGRCRHCWTSWWHHHCRDNQYPTSKSAVRSSHHRNNPEFNIKYDKTLIGISYTKKERTSVIEIRTDAKWIPPPPPPFNTSTPSSYPCFALVGYGSTDPCTVLPCLEEITGCGPDGYIDDMKQLLCDGIRTYYDRFTDKGKSFLNELKDCMVNRFKEAYSYGITPCCSNLEVWSHGTIEVQCFVDSGFCGIYFSNVAPLTAMFNKFGSVKPFSFYAKHCIKDKSTSKLIL